MTSALSAEPTTGTRTDGSAPPPEHRSRRGIVILIVVLVVAAAVAAAVVVARRSQATPTSTKSSVPLKPVPVEKRDLATYNDVGGTLGYGQPVTISEGGAISQPSASGAAAGNTAAATTNATTAPANNPTQSGASGARGGGAQAQAATPTTAKTSTTTAAPATTTTTAPPSNTVTILAPEGNELKRGDTVYAVDNQPRVLMYGATPAWRDMSAATTPGVDIYELKANLAALGYDPDHQLTADNTFDSATLSAVVRWQGDHGYAQDGVIKAGQIIFLPGPVRVGTHQLDPGTVARPGTPITQVTITQKVFTALSPTNGTVGSLAKTGTPAKAGTVLFTVDGQPTVVLTGATPIARTLTLGVADGDDIAVLEQNLIDLGDDPDKQISVDNHFDLATAAGILRLQAALGISQDDVLPAGRLLVVPTGLVVGAHAVEDGATVAQATPVLDLTASQRQVTANVNVADRASMKVGDAVQIEFADKSQKPAHITDLGALAAKTSNNANATPTVPVTAALDDNSSLDPSLVSTPVDVLFTKDSAKGVLAVPTAALVSLKEGGFAVQVADGGSNKLVGVKPGLYSDGYVQITGNGISEGTKVLVPA